ncbi:cellulose biosynthesis protein BcsQ [uncultured Herbaspirillum sp.]|uniref:cellulose biosynthesis protein BcsQ n=1 Tax=uncultured Herbaspirillum sp. TaxID=160236 RepID=UPI00258A8B24|nr:cellulose biosynthesis protein BcsQ [uncultured Herbaspirillum sp.]
MGNDISNLLSKFGATVDGYLEVEAAIDYKEPSRKVKAPQVAAPAEPGAAAPAPVVQASAAAPLPQDRSVSAPQRIEPVIEPVLAPIPEAPIVPVPEPVVAPVVAASPLQSPSQPTVPSPVQSNASRVPPPVVDVAAPVSAKIASLVPPAPPAVPNLLRSMLGEAAQQRQAQQEASPEGGNAGLSYGPPPSTPAHVIAVVSPKGGVGKTTLCSALACSLARHGRVIAVDLDPQNALQYHLCVNAEPVPAVAGQAADWRAALSSGMAGTQVVTHTVVAREGEAATAQLMAQDPHWLMRQLQAMHLQAGDVVLLDLPAGQTPYLEQALQAADQVLAVVTPDAGSFLALEHMRQELHGRNNCRYVVNKYDDSRSFCQDMLEVLRRWMGPRLAGVIALDHAISEGLAYGFNPLVKAGHSVAYDQLQSISDTLRATMAKSAVAGGRA